MNWMRESQEELKDYAAKVAAVESLCLDIATVKSSMTSFGGNSNSTPVKGGGNSYDDKILNMIVRKDKLEKSLACAMDAVSCVKCGLAVLSDEEAHILDMFYVHPEIGNVDRLCDELCVEKSQVYRRKDAALRHYTLARYGCVEV